MLQMDRLRQHDVVEQMGALGVSDRLLCLVKRFGRRDLPACSARFQIVPGGAGIRSESYLPVLSFPFTIRHRTVPLLSRRSAGITGSMNKSLQLPSKYHS